MKKGEEGRIGVGGVEEGRRRSGGGEGGRRLPGVEGLKAVEGRSGWVCGCGNLSFLK